MRWGGYLIWEDNYTEFALWSPDTRDFTQFFGVRFSDGAFRLEKLEKLTRPFLDHGDPFNAPIAFTEPAARRAEFYRLHPDAKPSPPSWTTAPPLPPLAPKVPPVEAHPAISSDTPWGASSYGHAATPVRLTETLDAPALVHRLETFLHRAEFPGLQDRAADLVKLLEHGGVSRVTPQDTDAAIEQAIRERGQALEFGVPAAAAFLDEKQISVLGALLRLEITRLQLHREALK